MHTNYRVFYCNLRCVCVYVFKKEQFKTTEKILIKHIKCVAIANDDSYRLNHHCNEWQYALIHILCYQLSNII